MSDTATARRAADELVAAAVAELSGADLAAALMQVLAGGGLSAFGKVEAVTGFEKLARWAQAHRLRLLGDLGDERGVHDSRDGALLLGAEVSMALGVGRHTADALVADAVAMRTRVPMVLDALSEGRVCERGAHAIVQETAVLPAPAAARVASAVLGRPDLRTVPRVRALTKAAVLRVDPATAVQREARAVKGRFVRADHRVEDGMVGWSAWLPAADSIRIWDRLRSLGDASRVPGDHRLPDARRADVLCDLLLSRPIATVAGDVVDTANPARRRVWRTDVVVEATTLQGRDEHPGHVPSWGPVTATTARGIACGGVGAADRPEGPAVSGTTEGSEAQWRRILTDPVTGLVTDYGTTRYKPPSDLADLVKAMDGRCYEPSCTVTAWRTDLDHIRPSPAGPSPDPDADGATSLHNLAPACRRHHRTKQAPGWQVRADDDRPGSYTWITPSGHTYRRHPEPPLPWHQDTDLDPPAPVASHHRHRAGPTTFDGMLAPVVTPGAAGRERMNTAAPGCGRADGVLVDDDAAAGCSDDIGDDAADRCSDEGPRFDVDVPLDRDVERRFVSAVIEYVGACGDGSAQPALAGRPPPF